jgi:hypothetical protein
LLLVPSQLPNPAVQVIPHDDAMHTAAELAGTGHAMPQRPQWAAAVVVLVSHPLPLTPSQSPAPAAH